MNEIAKRAWLYGLGLAVCGGLGYAVANCSTTADYMTLLGSAEVQLQLAHGMPAQDQQGRELVARTQMVVDAERNLRLAEQLEPGSAVTAELLGFARRLRGDYVGAAAEYRRARGCRDCGEEQRDVLAFNEARVLALAGQGEAALGVFAAHAVALDRRYGAQRGIEEAAILRQLGKTSEATARLDATLASAAEDPMARWQAGVEYLALGATEKAAAALMAAAPAVPIANYHLAQLKLQGGDVDTAMDLLARAAADVPAEVRRNLRKDASVWQAVAHDARFQELGSTRAAAPGR